jgi:hypothetical protein
MHSDDTAQNVKMFTTQLILINNFDEKSNHCAILVSITSEDDLYRKWQNNNLNFEKAYIKLADTSNKLMNSNLALGKEYWRAYDEISKSIYLSKQKSRAIINGIG